MYRHASEYMVRFLPRLSRKGIPFFRLSSFSHLSNEGVIQPTEVTDEGQDEDTFCFYTQWLPSFGVPQPRFSIHSVFLREEKTKIPKQTPFILDELSANLKEAMSFYWIDSIHFGDMQKYRMFWYYQWSKHGRYTNENPAEYFKMSIDFFKKLSPTLGLEPGKPMIINHLLSELKNTLGATCDISLSPINGYILVDDRRRYSMWILDEVKFATDKKLSKMLDWNYGNAKSLEEIILPVAPPVARYQSLVPKKAIVFMPQQPNHKMHLDQEFVRDITRKKLYMASEKAVKFMVVRHGQDPGRQLGVLVISACEHFDLNHEVFHRFKSEAPSMSQILVIVTGMEYLNWHEESYRNLKKKIQAIYPENSKLWKRLSTATFVPISVDIEENIKKKVAAFTCDWFTGKCLYEVLDKFELATSIIKHPRIVILDTYTVDSEEFIVCEIETGTLELNDTLMIMPGAVHVKVVGIYVGDTRRASARMGELVQLQLLHESDTLQHITGCVLSSIENLVPTVTEFEAKLCIFEDLVADEKLYLHMHYMEIRCEIKPITKECDEVLAKIKVYVPICIEKYSDVPKLGQFVIKCRGAIVASGKVARF
ncbi:hypothetical protein OROGR_026423 [Orobanche gracilis]